MYNRKAQIYKPKPGRFGPRPRLADQAAWSPKSQRWGTHRFKAYSNSCRNHSSFSIHNHHQSSKFPVSMINHISFSTFRRLKISATPSTTIISRQNSFNSVVALVNSIQTIVSSWFKCLIIEKCFFPCHKTFTSMNYTERIGRFSFIHEKLSCKQRSCRNVPREIR